MELLVKKQLQIVFLLSLVLIMTRKPLLVCAAYIALALFMIATTAPHASNRASKMVISIFYIGLLGCQLHLAYHFEMDSIHVLVGLLLLVISFLVKNYFDTENAKDRSFPSMAMDNTISLEDLKDFNKFVRQKLDVVKKSSEVIDFETIKEFVMDLPRHSSVNYVNKDSLSDRYFIEAEKALDEPYLYLAVSNTGSPASNILSVLTQKTYNHASISFDENLKTLVSYNGGERLYPPGLNMELLEWFYKKKDSGIMVYRLGVNREQKEKMLAKVKEINENGSSYNILGMAIRKSIKPNIMFCSQFIYSLLKSVDAHYFEGDPLTIKPSDLVEMDYYRKLEFVQEISFADFQEKYQTA